MKPEGVNPFGVYLNLDCVEDIESTINQWETSLRVAISVNRWELQAAIRFIEMTLLGNAALHWKSQSEENRSVILAGEDIGTIISRFVLVFKHEFLGEGYTTQNELLSRNKFKEALLRLELLDMCHLDEYLCAFTKYYYHCPDAIGNAIYLDLLYSKIPYPWGTKLLKDYPTATIDTLGRRISYLKEQLSKWCSEAILLKKTKRLGKTKENPLCCKDNSLPTTFENLPKYKQKQKRTYKRKTKRYFRKRKPWFYKKSKKGFNKRNYKKPIYKRNPKTKKKKDLKDCRCYSCNEYGHYANECPKKFNKKMILFDSDIEEMIDNNDFN